MHIEFQSLYLKRFRSFNKEATLHFNSAGTGLYFLKGKNHVQKALGSNGSGKSSLLDALNWCLYGKTVQGLKNPDIAPWTGKGTTTVELSLAIDGKHHTVKRTANPNLTTIDDKEAGQDYVDKLIGIPAEVIPYTVILGQRQPLFFDLGASEKLEVFSEALNLERWEQRSAHANEMVRGLESEIAASEREQQTLEAGLTTITQDIESAKAKRDLWEQQRTEILKNKSAEADVLIKQLAPLHKERDNADLKLDRAETELRALRPNLDKLSSERRIVEREFISVNSEILNLNQAIETALGQLQVVEQEGSCPFCKQPIKSHKKAIEADVKAQVAEYRKQKETHERRSKQLDADLEAKEVAINAEEAAKHAFQIDVDTAREVLDRVKPKISHIELSIAAAAKAIEEYEHQDNPYKEQFTTLRKRKGLAEQQIDQLEERLAAKRAYCEKVRFWIKGFKDIKLYTLETILQELEITTNGMLEEFGLTKWQVKYDIERETKAKTISKGLNITILSPNNKDPVKWKAWSGGEAQRLRIIGSAALSSVLLNHLGVSTNLEILDEPTESLSKEGVNDLVELLAQRAKDTKKQIWLVDHHLIESSHFADVITVEKDEHGSFIQS